MFRNALLRYFPLFVFLSLLLTGCTGGSPSGQQPITIAGASNLRFALDEISADFTRKTGIPAETVYASSGKLTAQIKAGAPYDVFLSADDRYPAALAAAGLTDGPARAYARGPLALWTTTSNIPLDPDSLQLARITKIAVPNPATAPYGRAAISFLKDRGLFDQLATKLVYGESVGQANQFVYTGAAEIGFSALATVSPGEKMLKFKVLEDHPPVLQSGVTLASSRQPEAAKAFLDYLLSPPAGQTLQKFGYFTAE